LLEWILDEAEIQPEIVSDADRRRRAEVPRIRGDAGLIRKDTGWAPERSIEESVREVYRWVARRYSRQQTPERPVIGRRDA
jgi:nucleoside-diphosphate-sugar epimerase